MIIFQVGDRLILVKFRHLDAGERTQSTVTYVTRCAKHHHCEGLVIERLHNQLLLLALCSSQRGRDDVVAVVVMAVCQRTKVAAGRGRR